ncbi:MAG: biopolymer transporter ExbD [Pseudomonadota bacterium]|jgi:biopolymer transport protein ExbD|nr:biopolymer transporter ExbD [Pseudomonadota bacterium]
MEFAAPVRRRRKPSLTPMIDVVFLLLVFFMLASRFGMEAVVPLPLAVQGGTYEGPPRLIDVSPASLALNGRPTGDLIAAVAPLMSQPKDMLILRGRDGASLQRIVEVTEVLDKAGFTSIVLVE